MTGTELSTNETNYTLTNNPTLVNGTVYTVKINGTDQAGNASGTITNTLVTFDTNPPTAFTMNKVLSTGGRVISGYYNTTSTGVAVTVNINNDASLVNGSIQLLATESVTNSYLPIGSPATITASNTTQTVNLTSGQITAIANYADGVTLSFKAQITDMAGNGPTTSTNAVSVLVDITPPTISGLLPTWSASSGAGGGGAYGPFPGGSRNSHDVIQFKVSEPLFIAQSPVGTITTLTSSSTVTGVGTIFQSLPYPVGTILETTGATRIGQVQSITNDLSLTLTAHATTALAAQSFKTGGVSGILGLSVNTGAIGSTFYANDASTNSVDGTITNTDLVYVESTTNNPWSGSTTISYSQSSGGSQSGNYIYDLAGNEMASFGPTTVSTGNTTTLASASNGVAVSPIANNSTNQVVLAFSLTSTSAVNFTAVSVTSSIDPTNLLSNMRIYANAGADNAASAIAGGSLATGSYNSGTGTVDFTGFSTGLSATAKYFYIVVNVNNYFFSSSPQIQFSLTSGNVTVSTGARAGSTQTGTNYTLHDGTVPTISLTVSNPTLFDTNTAPATQVVTVQYNEPMDNTSTPAISLSAGTWTGPTGGWSTTTLTNDTYKATFTYAGTNQYNAAVTANVTGGGKDWGGNTVSGSSSSFVLDTQLPTVNSITISPTPVTTNSTQVTVVIKFSESMTTGAVPGTPVTFSAGTWSLVVGGGSQVWSTTTNTNDTYTLKYNWAGGAQTLAGVTASANGYTDANTNVQTSAGTSAGFLVDTQPPTVSSITRGGANQYTKGPSVSYTVTFSESVSNVQMTDFTPVKINGTVSLGSVNSISGSGTTYVVTVTGLTGDGDTRLDLNTSGSITDANTNLLTAGHTGDEIYSIDNTPPTVIGITPINVNAYASTVNGVTVTSPIGYVAQFSEKVNGIDPGFKDFNGVLAPNTNSTININRVNITSVHSTTYDDQWQLNASYGTGVGTFQVDFNPGSGSSTNAFVLATVNAVITRGQYYGQDQNLLSLFEFNVIPNFSDVYVFNPSIGNYSYIATKLYNDANYIYFNPSRVGAILPYNFASPQNFSQLYFDPAPTSLGLRTGTINATFGSTTVTGTGTAFLGEVRVNDLIFINYNAGAFIGRVKQVNSDNSLTLYEQAYTTYSGTFETRRPSFAANNSAIVDQAGNAIVQSYFEGTYGNFCAPEPASATGFTATPANTTLTVNWTDASTNPLYPTAYNYLVMLRNKNAVVTSAGPTTPVGTFPVAGTTLKDGVYFANDTDFTDGLMMLNISQGTQTAIFTGLNSGADYEIKIYSYSLDNNNIITGDHSAIDYNLTPASIASAITSISSTTTVTNVSSAASIPSTVTASAGQTVLSFKITDDGLGTNDDNSPFKFNTIKIIPGTVTIDWAANILGAQLTNSGNGVVKTGVINGGTAASSNITFSGLSSAVGAEGYVADNSSKTYTLNIWLKPTVADNSLLDFKVDNTSFTAYDNTSNNQASSQLSPSSSTSTGTFPITVTATALRFTTQPVLNPGTSSQQYVKVNFTTAPVAKAMDANGNIDVDYNLATYKATITTPTNGPTFNTTTVTPVAGVYTFPAGFQYNDAGTLTNVGTLTLTTPTPGGAVVLASINSNSGSGFVACSLINVVYYGGTTLSNGTGLSGAGGNGASLISSIASSNVAVFQFKVSDDGGAPVDGESTIITSFKFTSNAASDQFASQYQNLIASATLSDGTNTMTITPLTGGINVSDLTFSSIPAALGTVSPSGGTKTYTLSIIPKGTLGGGLPSTADNLKLVLDILNTAGHINVTTATNSSTIPVGQSAASGGSNGSFQVIATKTSFITQPPATGGLYYLENTILSSASQPGAPPLPSAEAVDTYGNRDKDYSGAVNGAVSISSTYTFSGAPTSFTSGVLSTTDFNNMQFTSIGTNQTFKITPTAADASGTPAPATSGGFDVKVGNATVISSPVVLGSVSSIHNAQAQADAVFQFDINEDGVNSAGTPNDGSPTLISSIVIKQSSATTNNKNAAGLATWTDAIAGAILSDGTHTSVGAVGPNTITFSSMVTSTTFPYNSADIGYVADGSVATPSKKTYTLSIWLKTNLGLGVNTSLPSTIDGQKFAFDIAATSDVSVDSHGTGIGSGTAWSTSGNTVTVVATQADFTSEPPASYSTFTDLTPYMVVTARDVNANTDLDWTGAIGTISNSGTHGTGPGSELKMANIPLGNFVAGVFSFSLYDTNHPGATFQFNEDSGLETGQQITLTVPATSLTSAVSTPFKVLGSYDSWMFFDPIFATSTNSTISQQVDFVHSVDISGAGTTPTTSTSKALAKIVLSDGGYAKSISASPVYTRTSLLAKGTHNDSDGGNTKISDFTVSFLNSQDISKIGLYTWNGTQIGSDYAGAASINFTNLAGYPAPDDDTITYVIRAVFKQNITSDQDQVQMQITQVHYLGGSNFPENDPTVANRPSPATIGGVYIAGLGAGDVPPAGYNFLNVIATSLDFSSGVDQPSSIAGYYPSPVGIDPATSKAGKATARDIFGNVDKNFVSGVITVTDGNGIAITPPSGGWAFGSFASSSPGVMDLTGMIYNSTGNGKVRVQTNNAAAVSPIPTSLDSNVPTGVSFACNPVQVINTTVEYNTNGILTGNGGKYNLKGGLSGNAIFGLDFKAQGSNGTDPVLKTFIIGFKTGPSCANNCGNNWFYSTNNGGTVIFDPNTLDVTLGGASVKANGGSVTAVSSASAGAGNYDQIKVDLTNFTSPKKILTSSAVTAILTVDVSTTTSSATPTLRPYLVDFGYNDPSESNIVVSNGSAYSIIYDAQNPTAYSPLLDGSSIPPVLYAGEIDGVEYSFASATPPILLADKNVYPTTKTSPYTAQPNVNPANPWFDPNGQIPSPPGVTYLDRSTSPTGSPAYPRLVLQFNTAVGVLDNPANTPTGHVYDSLNNIVADLFLDITSNYTDASNNNYIQSQAAVGSNGQLTSSTVYSYLIFNLTVPGQPNTPALALKPNSVYYVNIVQGSYDPFGGTQSGISDQQLNFFGGVTDKSTLYFKTWTTTAPVASNVSSSYNVTGLGTLIATFDQLGTAYFVVLKSPSTTPTSTYHVTNPVAGSVNLTNSFSIQNVGVPQTIQFPANSAFVGGSAYDVYIVTINNSTPVDSSAIQVFKNVIPASGPSAVGTLPPTPATFTPNAPAYNICGNSYIYLTQPMVITEKSKSDFNKSGTQTINILLPPGFEFDTKPAYPAQVNLGPASGTDFTGVATTSFTSNTVMQIQFQNSTSSYYDVISISNLRVIGKKDPITGALPSSGAIKWYYGNDAMTSAGYTPFKIADINVNTPINVPDFTNSYWSYNNQVSPYHSIDPTAQKNISVKVNAIPDNYGTQVTLLPISTTFPIRPPEDYLASTFSGTGVSGSALTLAGTTLDAAFNIVMSHTDNNGCAYTKSEQYVVYKHASPISTKLGVTNNLNPATNLIFTPGTVQDIVNSNFNSASPTAASISPIPIKFSDKAGYKLLELQADLPVVEIDNNNHSFGIQLMTGALWRNWIKSLPTSSPIPGGNQYSWDYSNILNAPNTVVQDPISNNLIKPISESTNPPVLATSAINNVYDYFKQVSPNNTGNYWWKGGSLGQIEFTGIYQSTADPSVYAPFRQDVELFVPSVPIVEVQSTNVVYDNNDAGGKIGVTKAPTLNNSQYTNYKGTATFCEYGGQITLVAYPQAQGGTSVGKFAIYDYASYNFLTNTGSPLIAPAPNSPFVDNGNGTMTLDPTNAAISNFYNDVLVTYTYQDFNSPAVGIGYLVIRVTANPKPAFTMSSVQAAPGLPGSSAFDAYCSNNVINFDASVSTVADQSHQTFPLAYNWNFGDNNSNSNTDTTKLAIHNYAGAGNYQITLSATSGFGCQSLTYAVTSSSPGVRQTSNVLYSVPVASSNTAGALSVPIVIGEIPQPDFTFTGNCINNAVNFADNTAALSSGRISEYDWYFDFGGNPTKYDSGYNKNNVPNVFPVVFNTYATHHLHDSSKVKHMYTTPNIYSVQLTTITNLGCQASQIRLLGQLNTISSSVIDFNTGSSGSGSAGFLPIDISVQPFVLDGVTNSSGYTGRASWKWTGSNWSTVKAVNGTYYAGENSALYAACIDVSVPRPMLSFDANVDINNSDGLVLQFSSDSRNILNPTKKWYTLGADTTSGSIIPGIDWYNGSAIASAPGSFTLNSKIYGYNQKNLGWTGASNVFQPKHALDNGNANITKFTNTLVQFRFVLATSSNNTPLTGVSIDNLRFGSRTRTIMFENFTTTDPKSVPANTIIAEDDTIRNFVKRNIQSTQLVNVNYHIGFEGQDPFNLANPADNGARALFYGVKKVPYAFLDGQHYTSASGPSSDPDSFQNWGQYEYDLNTLSLAQADFLDKTTINCPTCDSTKVGIYSGGTGYTPYDWNKNHASTLLADSVVVNVNFTPMTNMPIGPNGTALQVGILEKVATANPATPAGATFDYVLRKLLPDASGKLFSDSIKGPDISPPNSANSPKYYPVSVGKYKWIPKDLPSKIISVVLFLQNTSDKHVYQAELFDGINLGTNLITEIEPTSENVKIYPNPADQELNIELPSPAKNTATLRLANQLGVFFDFGTIAEGEQRKTISTAGLSEGVYILQLGSGNNAVRSKVLVLHK